MREEATPHYEDTRQHKSDGEGLLGKDFNLTSAQHLARHRATYAEPDKESASVIRGREQAGAKQDAESLRGRTTVKRPNFNAYTSRTTRGTK
jgi:hypothetical protein